MTVGGVAAGVAAAVVGCADASACWGTEGVSVLGAGSVVPDAFIAAGRGLNDPVLRTVADMVVTRSCGVAVDRAATLDSTAAATSPASDALWFTTGVFTDPKAGRGDADAALAEWVLWLDEPACVLLDPVSACATPEPLASAAPTPNVIAPAPSQM
ncbi:hypothetical protein ORI20_30755 [Mycobacterium sp. CVI_P3]|uniref:Uncharacterized protein n=1 Tax=Mycobacterium pinniadriaticum TaxID=2994102 RepID=A0ABT3SNH5_9MYCO|nr:hypothetical protein [Mycobacterium pinniadriaticum]MCX2934653.1 hypothetical protein [Mycobacterium pinniadriaticum]MCX2941076.1 hypothetical protein [Mycobacterium pinniadriaticum]